MAVNQHPMTHFLRRRYRPRDGPLQASFVFVISSPRSAFLEAAACEEARWQTPRSPLELLSAPPMFCRWRGGGSSPLVRAAAALIVRTISSNS